MKCIEIGDLVKFVGHTMKSGPLGIILRFKNLTEPPHPSQPHRRSAYIEWACKYTTSGHYQLSILEVVNEET
jgi:hypothetical protein|tara:strand:+ start:29272 stop:29487 length:216 start_codon:yes stop_codon:yes gene_type:complete